MSEDWRARSACLTEDPELFFPKRKDSTGIDKALQVCAGCPVARQCLQFAKDNRETTGIWGGKVFLPPEKDVNPARSYKYGPDVVHDVRELYLQEVSYRDIAKRLELTHRQVRHIMSSFGITNTRMSTRDRIAAERDERIREMRAKGLSRPQIAAQLGVSLSTVDNARRRAAA